jgi:5'(3')-deoxyribonucleotidase
MKCYLDMDGVLADFIGGACKAHGRPYPYENESALGIWDTEKLWGISAAEFWQPIDAYDKFWDTLDKTAEADILVDMVTGLFGRDNVAVLTAPSMDPTCVPGKRRWMQRHYPWLSKKMIFASHEGKQFMAGKDTLLIDDKDSNVVEFREAGGSAILMPRHWNVRWMQAEVCLAHVQEQLNVIGEAANAGR